MSENHNVVAICKTLIDKKLYAVAEETLWLALKEDYADPQINALMGILKEETRQYKTALNYYDVVLKLEENEDISQRRERCIGQEDDPLHRINYNDLVRTNARFEELQTKTIDLEHEVSFLKDRLRFTESQRIIAKAQLEALQQDHWPDIAKQGPERWTIDKNEFNEFTMDGAAEFSYQNDNPEGELTSGPIFPSIYTDSQIDKMLEMITNGENFVYGAMDDRLRDALEKHPIEGKAGAVMGSLSTWYESFCLAYGAFPTTVEYREIICHSERIKTMLVADYYELENEFDFGISISSFEHDGLGCYGIPRNPQADIIAMQKMKQTIKPGGLLFLSIPVGIDQVYYPSLRIYGRSRLPKMLDGWEIISSYEFDEDQYDKYGMHEPLFVLKNI